MQYLFDNNKVDYNFLHQYSKDYEKLKKHLLKKNQTWASKVCGVKKEEIHKLANLISKTKKVFIRLGYGFTRQRNGSFNMHAVTCIHTVIGAWKN